MNKLLKKPLKISPDAALVCIKELRLWLRQEMGGKIKPCKDYTPGCINCTSYVLDGFLEEEESRLDWEIAQEKKKPAKKKS